MDEDEWSPQGPVIELSDERAWELLDGKSFGRLALSVRNLPLIFPVDYFADGTTILFRTAEGTKLHALAMNSAVAFEADAVDVRESWSVVVEGIASVLTDEADIFAADLLPLPRWIPTASFVYVRIAPTSIRGRLFFRKLEPERRL